MIIMSASALKMVGGPLHSLGTPTKEYLVFTGFYGQSLILSNQVANQRLGRQ